ncbi:MAG: CDP-alcohol phosphatidyltransferase family protein, partial [Candidatus Eisenbacteria bacterium]
MFIEEYLVELRRERFAPAALLTYARRVGARVRSDVLANPGAVRSIWAVGLAFFAAAFLASMGMALAWDRDLAERFFLHTALWMLPAFTFVTLFVGHLRDAGGHRLSGLNIPLVLTLARVSLVPGIAVFLVDRHFVWALALYVLASLTDVFDGYLARRWKQTTALGTVLDPLVDIVFNLTMLAGLAAAELLDSWVFWVAVLRYGILLVGGSGLYLFVGPLRVQPTWFGRMTGVVMTTLIALFTLLVAVRGPLGEGLTRLTEIALGVLLSATVLQVLVLGWYNLRLLTGAV